MKMPPSMGWTYYGSLGPASDGQAILLTDIYIPPLNNNESIVFVDEVEEYINIIVGLYTRPEAKFVIL